MSDITSLASALYPDLPTAADDAAPVQRSERPATNVPTRDRSSPAGPGDDGRSIAERLYPDLPSEADAAPERPAERAPTDAGEPAEAGASPDHLVAQFNALAAEAGLSRQRSEALMKLHEKALADTSVRYWNEQGAAWEKQSRAQFGSRLNAMVGAVQPLLNDPALTPKAFVDLLQTYRIGSHPVVIDTLSRWAAAMRSGPGTAGKIGGETPVEKRLRVIRSGIARRG